MNIEEVKKRKDGLDVIHDIYRYAELGHKAVSPDDEALFRWHGIYTQRPAEDGFFMVRLRIPGGDLTPDQLRQVADLSIEHGRGLADITVRQNIQLHWVRIESLPDILDRLRLVGLSTTEACGDCVRNIINCPVSGADAHELYDTTQLLREINDYFVGNRDFSNLPRKFKIAVTGCHVRCVYPEINDVGIFAVRDGAGGVAFRARIGGGLSTTPRFSKDLGVLVGPEEVVELCAAVASVFRDEGNRENRKRARLKFLVEQWEIPRFREEVEARLGRKLRRAESSDAEPITERDRTHLGIHRQRDPGLNYVGISILGGRTSGDDLKRLAALAEEYGSGRVRTTNTQNIILLDVPERNLSSLTRELDRSHFDYKPNWARRGIIACTGVQFCKLALAETKNRAVELDEHLAKTAALDDSVRISVTGCPNACGQHHICDVGLEGSLTTINGVKRETFQVFLGGGVGAHESFGRRVGARIPSDELAESLARLFARYKDDHIAEETFQEYCLRHSNEELVAYLTPPLAVNDARTAHGQAKSSNLCS
ncbi:MAG: nitrite/sulfite reductase [Blastocatellia bacterium]